LAYIVKYLTAALLSGFCIAVSGCNAEENANGANVEAPPPLVEVKPVRQATVPISEDYEGTIGAIDSVEIRARVQGTLDSAPFKEGTLVHKGDVIFRIQQDEYAAAYQAAQAQLATARAQVAQSHGNYASRQAALARADTTVARNRPLAADKAIPQKDLDNAIQNQAIAQGDVEVAQAQIESANAAVLAGQAAVDNAKINLDYTTIRAPVTGLIGFLNYTVGNVVGGPSTEVLDTISSIDPVKVTFGVDEATYLALSGIRGGPTAETLRNQELHLVLANNQPYQYTGRAYTINPTVDPKTGTLTVEARFPNPDGLLRPGGFARVRVVTEYRQNALLVPQTAITKSQGVDTVYVVDKNDEVALRSVTLGPQFEQSFVVTQGLNPGERVITVGTQKVKPGQKVSIKS
jgi:membrane fusion protein, multidrug efflux system